jgi:phage tail P2-like protein
VQSIIAALDPELRSVSFDTREALIYSRIGELPEPVIDLLAWQFHVDFYEPESLPLEIKRGLVKSSILVHKRKGTEWAVRELCGIAFGDAEIYPWFEYGGEPYHFSISIDATLPTAEAWRKFFLALEVTKSVRDWLDAIEVRRGAAGELFYGLGTATGGSMVVGIGAPAGARCDFHAGLGVSVSGVINIFSSEEVMPDG